MVVRLKRIFGDPVPPSRVTQEQFDGAQVDLERTAGKPWHEIDQSDYWHYLNDLCYVDLQQDLFDYLFPAFLIRWWEGQLSRQGGPESESDFYRAVDRGELLTKMMSETRRELVLDWITDAYIEGVDAWSNHLSVGYVPEGPDDLHGPLSSFNALGQSIPVIKEILSRLEDVSTIGRAQWWLVFAAGLVWNENECPAIPKWAPGRGGGGVYITMSQASIYDHGFLPENLQAFRSRVSCAKVTRLLEQCTALMPSVPHGAWAQATLEELLSRPQRIEARLAKLIQYYELPDLGGIDGIGTFE